MGNAEFMVILPFLGILAFGKYIKFSSKSWLSLAIGIGIWNVGFHIIPKSIFNEHKNQEIRTWLHSKKAQYFVAYDRTEFTNYMDWKNACEGKNKRVMVWDALRDNEEILDSIKSGAIIYTDKIDYPKTLDRRSFAIMRPDDFIRTKHRLDSIPTWRGFIFLDEIKARKL